MSLQQFDRVSPYDIMFFCRAHFPQTFHGPCVYSAENVGTKISCLLDPRPCLGRSGDLSFACVGKTGFIGGLGSRCVFWKSFFQVGKIESTQRNKMNFIGGVIFNKIPDGFSVLLR